MTHAKVLELIISAFLGAALALLAQWLVGRARRAATARALTVAFWEELSAAEFASHGATNNPPVPRYLMVGGFSSQTFDSLFHEMAISLPGALARDLMRYHWRVKFLVEAHKDDYYMDGHAEFYHDAKRLHEDLLRRLMIYSGRGIVRLMLRGRE